MGYSYAAVETKETMVMTDRSIDVGQAKAVQEGVADAQVDEEEEVVPAPWHFKVLVVGTVGYLIYRLIWLIFWLTGHAWNG